MMRPRPFGSGVASAAAAEVSVGAGCRGGWAWRPRPRARPGQRVRVRGEPAPHAAAAASAVHAEPHHGERFRPFGLPRAGFGSDLEAGIEKVIYACRFMAFLGIAGSLAGSVLCFLKVLSLLNSSARQVHLRASPSDLLTRALLVTQGCTFVMDAFVEYYLRGDAKVVLMLIEAIGNQTVSSH
uniref:Uncharacterized protein n=1 Tax=Aegilops tauschii subsp. strangulata TaxID=200361 RepID=A0A453SM24_AEGTS